MRRKLRVDGAMYETDSTVVNGAATVLHAAWCRAILAALLTDGPPGSSAAPLALVSVSQDTFRKHTPRRNCI